MYYYAQLFSTPFRFISSRPDPLKVPRPAGQSGQAPTGGTVWTREQWYTALSDVQDAGYRRLEMMSATVLAKPIVEIQALLEQYGLMLNHVWHSGRLYPKEVADTTIAKAIEALDYIKPLKPPEFFIDPFGDCRRWDCKRFTSSPYLFRFRQRFVSVTLSSRQFGNRSFDFSISGYQW